MTRCAECGAEVPSASSCAEHFHALLALEAEVPGAAGEEPHFLAVATYNLQHPRGFVPAALLALRSTVADVLAGRATVADARRRARYAADGSSRVRRRPDTPITEPEQQILAAWPTRWQVTVRDVSTVAPDEYVSQVRAWASSVSDALAQVIAAMGNDTQAE